MKITMYELLGMVKDDKAPKKIKYINSIWEYDENTKDYIHDDLWLIYSMNSMGLTESEVEIIEEPQEHKIPEKIEYHQVRRNEVEVDYIEDGIVKHFCLNKKQRYFADKINEILDYLEEIE